MEMLGLQHIFGGGRNTSMEAGAQKNEIPAGWNLWNFESTLQKIYVQYSQFLRRQSGILQTVHRISVISCSLHISNWFIED